MSKRTYVAHYAAAQPSDTDSVSIDYKFVALGSEKAHEIATQFVEALNREPFAGFVFEHVKAVK